MKKTIFLLPLLIFFTACSMNAIPDSADSPLGDTPPDFVLADLTLTSGGELSSQGIPFDESGNAVVTSLVVSVYDDSDTLVTFDDDFRIDASGSNDVIEFALGENAAVTLVIGESYTFKAKAFDSDGVWMGYDEVIRTVEAEGNIVTFELKTLIESVNISISTPMGFVKLGQSIDFFTIVKSPGGYDVPIQDFSMSASVAAIDGEITTQTKRGLRIKTADTVSDESFDLSVTATGWKIVDGEAVENTDVTALFSKPFLSSNSFSFDTTRPSLSVNTSGTFYASMTYSFTGTSSDDIGIAKLQVYDGVDLIGSSHSDDFDAKEVAQVSFSGDEWSMPWKPKVAGNNELTVFSIDTSGNQTVITATLLVENDTFAPKATINASKYSYVGPMTGIASDAQTGVARVDIYAQRGSSPPALYSSTVGGGIVSLSFNRDTGAWSSPIDINKVRRLIPNAEFATMKLVVTDRVGNIKETTTFWCYC